MTGISMTDNVDMSPFVGVLWPVEVPRITMPFRAFDTKWYSPSKPHKGVDTAPWAGSGGASVRAPLSGRITYVGNHEYAGLELVLEAQVPYEFWATTLSGATHQYSPDSYLYVRMSHHSSIGVTEGDRVSAGQEIAQVGNTGLFTTGPHVHMEVWLNHYRDGGILVDPLDFFLASIVGLKAVLEYSYQPRREFPA